MNPDWVSIYVLETEALVRTSVERYLRDYKEKNYGNHYKGCFTEGMKGFNWKSVRKEIHSATCHGQATDLKGKREKHISKLSVNCQRKIVGYSKVCIWERTDLLSPERGSGKGSGCGFLLSWCVSVCAGVCACTRVCGCISVYLYLYARLSYSRQKNCVWKSCQKLHLLALLLCVNEKPQNWVRQGCTKSQCMCCRGVWWPSLGLDDKSSKSGWCCSQRVVGKGTERWRLPKKFDTVHKRDRDGAYSQKLVFWDADTSKTSLGGVWQADLYIFLSMSFERIESLKDLPGVVSRYWLPERYDFFKPLFQCGFVIGRWLRSVAITSCGNGYFRFFTGVPACNTLHFPFSQKPLWDTYVEFYVFSNSES